MRGRAFAVPAAGTAVVVAAALAVAALAVPPAAAQSAAESTTQAAPRTSSNTIIGGSVIEQAYASYSGSGEPAWSDLGYGSSTTLGLSLDAKGSRARASASLEAAVLDGTAAQNAWLLIQAGAVPTDELFVPAARPPGGPDLLAAARVRTLYVKYDADWASFTAGRQVINYERGALWSPTDIFTDTELDLTGLSPVRLGSDALRLTFPLGATGGLDLAAAPTTLPAQARIRRDSPAWSSAWIPPFPPRATERREPAASARTSRPRRHAGSRRRCRAVRRLRARGVHHLLRCPDR